MGAVRGPINVQKSTMPTTYATHISAHVKKNIGAIRIENVITSEIQQDAYHSCVRGAGVART